MSGTQRLFELIMLGGCAFLLTKALLPVVLPSQQTPTEGNPERRLILAISYLGVVMVLVPWHWETMSVLRRNWALVNGQLSSRSLVG